MNLPTHPEPTLEKENEYAFSRPHPRLTVARLTKANISRAPGLQAIYGLNVDGKIH